MTVAHSCTELTGITAPGLGDPQALAALSIAAAGALGLIAHGPPITRAGPGDIAVVLLGRGGHVVLHARPDDGTCVVDVVTPAVAPPGRAVEVVARRLGATAATAP
jgi:S-adenosylmethionine/arginine decarboxylase-like enzyme